MDSLDEIKQQYYLLKQGQHESLQAYHERFIAHVEVMEQVGVTMYDGPVVEEFAPENWRSGRANDDDRAAAAAKALAMRFIRNTNNEHSGYLTHLRNSFLDGNDDYPITVHDAYNILQRWEKEHTRTPSTSEGMSFVNAGYHASETRTCYNCGESGHISPNCPNPRKQDQAAKSIGKKEQGISALSMGKSTFTFTQVRTAPKIPQSWILLDSGATVDIIRERSLVNNVCQADHEMVIWCNAGSRRTKMIADLPGYGTVWYDPNAIANILSLKQVKAKYRVKYDSNNGGQFTVEKPDGTMFFL